jgi:hypothetical protein
MPIGVIVGEPVTEPDQLFDAEAVPEAHFDVGLGKIRIAVGVEQALARGERRALAVDVD